MDKLKNYLSCEGKTEDLDKGVFSGPIWESIKKKTTPKSRKYRLDDSMPRYFMPDLKRKREKTF